MNSIRRLVVSASVAFAISACHSAYDSGLDRLAAGEYSDAAKLAQDGLREAPDDPELNLLMAEALVGDEQYAPAEPYARRAFKSEALKAPAGRTLGKILWELGQPIGAVDVWRTAREAQADIVTDDDYIRGLEIAISTAMSIHEFAKAIELRDELARLDPDHAEVQPEARRRNREALAQEQQRAGELERSAENYAALYADFKDPRYLFERGRVLLALDPEQAKEAFHRYVDADATNERVSRAISVAERAEKAGKLPTAIIFYDLALELMGDEVSLRRASIHLTLAGLLLSSRALDEGRTQVAAFIEQHRKMNGTPIAADIFLQAANVATENRAPEVGIEILEQALRDGAPGWRTAMMLAELYARRSRNADVERVLKTYVAKAENVSAARVNAGRWASSRRNYELAAFFFEAAVSEEDASTALWYEMARVYAATGRLEDMRRSLDNYLKRSNNSANALSDVAALYRSQRLYDQAEGALLKAFKKTPTKMGAVQDLESLYREWGRNAKIHDVYEAFIKARGNRAEDYAMVAGRFMRQNEWDDALPYLTKAAAKGDSGAWLQMADVFKRQRKERDMKEALAKYLEGATNRQAALEDVWQRYRTSNWSHEGIPILEELVGLQATNIVYYEELSDLYFQQGRDVEAFELWKRFIEGASDPVRALESMTRRFERRGHDEWMLSLLERMAEKDGEQRPALYRLLGDAHYAAAQRRGRVQFERDENVIFSAEDRARTYYKIYLSKAKPSAHDLEVFADSLRYKRLWDVAAMAYEQLDLSLPEMTDELLAYGMVLLNLGRPQDASRVFADFYERRGKSLDAARQVADVLAPSRQYRVIEPYLWRLMESGDENQLRNAFVQLADVLRQTDRPREIGPLITDYLAKSQNPMDARRTSLTVIEAAGLWDEGVRQLERIVDTEGEETRFELGKMLFRTGREDDAEAAFRAFASNSVVQGEAWWRVATFFEAHAKVELAEDAYNAAVAAAPQNDTVMTDRGRFRILIGRFQDGQHDLEAARSMVDHARKGAIYRVEVDALLQVGRFHEAREAARKALRVAYLDRDYFARVAAEVELGSGDSGRAQRFMDELKAGGLPTDVFVELLVEHGYLEAAAAAIEDEVQSGDYTLGGDLALTYADVFTALGGIDRFVRTVQPLFDRAGDGRILGQVGDYLVSEGQYEKGALYLRASVDQGSVQYRPLLVQTYLLLGYEDEAVRQFQATLLETPAGSQGLALESMAPMFELLTMRPVLRSLLEQLSPDPRFQRYAAPMLVHMLVEDGQIERALDAISRSWAAQTMIDEGATAADSDLLETADTAVAMLQALAAEGFLWEAAALIGSMPSALQNQDVVKDFALRLAVLREADGIETVDSALSALGVSASDQMKRLKIAQLLAYSGQTEKSKALALPLLSAGDFEVAREALHTLISVSRITHDVSNNAKWVDEFIAQSSDKAGARSVATDLLRVVADDKNMVQLSRETLSLVPTDSNVRMSIHHGHVSGSLPLFQASSSMYWHIATNPVLEVGSYSLSLMERGGPEYVDALLGNYLDAFPDIWSARSSSIKMHYRLGEVDAARDEIVAYLDSVQYDVQAVEAVMTTLASWQLWGEVARFVAPKIPDSARSTRVLRDIGRANVYLGFVETGVSALDRFIAASADPAMSAVDLANELMDAGHTSEALRYAELAVQKRPGRSRGYLARGMARVAMGQDGDEDIARGISDGAGRILTLYRIGKLALRANRPDVAAKYLEQLARTPRAKGGPTWMPLALDAYRTTDHQADGVAFVEERWPHIAAGIGASAGDIVPVLAGLYEGAGMVERVFSVYEEGIRAEFVTRPFDGGLPTLRNNLAYVYSTANQHIDEGIDLIGQAMAADPQRNASFIDTLGWLYYRQGKIDAAHAEVTRALRSSTGNPSELVELYQHLAELEERRGNSREASWIRVFAGMIEQR